MDKTADRESEGFFSSLFNKYEEAWQMFILPGRSKYTPDLLGPQIKRMSSGTYIRKDKMVTNLRGVELAMSFYQRADEMGEVLSQDGEQQKCLIYLHSHGGSRLEGLSLMNMAWESGMHFCVFDFAGSGLSKGKYTTLGIWEAIDCRAIVEELQNKHGIDRFVLWGRSMGAVAALIYASGNQPHIEALVLDSPFSSVDQMVRDVGNNFIALGEYPAVFLFGFVRDEIKKRIGQDIGELAPIIYCKDCKMPCIFVIGNDDPLVLPERVEQMYGEYSGNPKKIIKVKGTHSSGREYSDIDNIFKNLVSILPSTKAKEVGLLRHRSFQLLFKNKFNSSSSGDKSLDSGQAKELKPQPKITQFNEKAPQREVASQRNQNNHDLHQNVTSQRVSQKENQFIQGNLRQREKRQSDVLKPKSPKSYLAGNNRSPMLRMPNSTQALKLNLQKPIQKQATAVDFQRRHTQESVHHEQHSPSNNSSSFRKRPMIFQDEYMGHYANSQQSHNFSIYDDRESLGGQKERSNYLNFGIGHHNWEGQTSSTQNNFYHGHHKQHINTKSENVFGHSTNLHWDEHKSPINAPDKFPMKSPKRRDVSNTRDRINITKEGYSPLGTNYDSRQGHNSQNSLGGDNSVPGELRRHRDNINQMAAERTGSRPPKSSNYNQLAHSKTRKIFDDDLNQHNSNVSEGFYGGRQEASRSPAPQTISNRQRFASPIYSRTNGWPQGSTLPIR